MSEQTVVELDLAEEAGIVKENEKQFDSIEGLISFDDLVMNFIQQYGDTMEDYKKLRTALDSMHYTSTITKISLEELQVKKDLLNKLAGAVEALSLYKKHVDPNVTEKEFTFEE